MVCPFPLCGSSLVSEFKRFVLQRSATSTPQKTKMSDYVFGSSFGGTGFAAIAASGKTAFGSASSTPKSTFASLASTNQPSEAGQKTEGQDAFSTLLSTPHKAKTDKDLAGNPNTEEDSAPGTPMLTPMKPEVAEQKGAHDVTVGLIWGAVD